MRRPRSHRLHGSRSRNEAREAMLIPIGVNVYEVCEWLIPMTFWLLVPNVRRGQWRPNFGYRTGQVRRLSNSDAEGAVIDKWSIRTDPGNVKSEH